MRKMIGGIKSRSIWKREGKFNAATSLRICSAAGIRALSKCEMSCHVIWEWEFCYNYDIVIQWRGR